MKGGYLIIDLQHKAIDTSTGTTYAGLYDKIEAVNGKAVFLQGVTIGSTEYNVGTFVTPIVSGDDFTWKAFGYKFTLDDDDKIVVAVDKASNVATSTATDVAGCVTSINAILTALKGAGIMVADSANEVKRSTKK